MGNDTVIYTSIFGGYDGLLPQPKLKGVDYVCFSDRQLRASPWQVRIVPRRFDDPVRSAREYKILPHKFLREYRYSVWIDGNFLVVGQATDLIKEVLKDASLAIFDHNQTSIDPYDCIYHEFDVIMQVGRETGDFKDDPALMRRQIERYKAEGYPSNNGLISSGVLIRRHHDAALQKTMEHWWREIVEGSRRDQLSFNYVAWKDGFNYHIIDGDIRKNRWFFMIGIHRRNYRLKYLKYRLRRFFRLVRHP